MLWLVNARSLKIWIGMFICDQLSREKFQCSICFFLLHWVMSTDWKDFVFVKRNNELEGKCEWTKTYSPYSDMLINETISDIPSRLFPSGKIPILERNEFRKTLVLTLKIFETVEENVWMKAIKKRLESILFLILYRFSLFVSTANLGTSVVIFVSYFMIVRRERREKTSKDEIWWQYTSNDMLCFLYILAIL